MEATKIIAVKNFLNKYGFVNYTEFYKVDNAVSYDDMVFLIEENNDGVYIKRGQRFTKGRTLKLFKQLAKTMPEVFTYKKTEVNEYLIDTLFFNI